MTDIQHPLSSKRIVWIDYAKAFAITLVVLLHMPVPDPYHTIFYSFTIPLFFFLSGLFSNPERYASFANFFKHKTLRLFIPYILFSLLNYLYWLLVARHFGADAGTTTSLTKPLLGILLGIGPWMYHYKPLWFLPCLMTTEILFYLTYKLLHKKPTLLAIASVAWMLIGYLCSCLKLPVLPYCFGGACTMFFFYYIGFYTMQKKEMVCDYTHKGQHIWLIGVSAIIVLVLCSVLSVQTQATSVSSNTYGDLLYAFPAAILGCSGIVGLSVWLAQLCYSKVLAYIGAHTLPILALHLTIAGWIKGITTFIFRLPLDIYDALSAKFLLGIVVVIACIPCCYAYDKIEKYLLVHQ